MIAADALPPQLRLFVAAPLPPALTQELDHLRQVYADSSIRLVPPENLHLTLFFIGSYETARLPELVHLLSEIASWQPAFALTLQALEPGPSRKRPRLIWARFAADPAFAQLMKALHQKIAPDAGVPAEAIPHITLARFRKDARPPADLPVVQPEHEQTLLVNEMALWRSELGQPHPRYSILQHFPFAAE